MPLTRIDSAFLDLDALGGIDFDVQSGVPTLSVDATTHRVGIGTDTPARKLQIHENSSSGSFLSFTNTTTGASAADGALIGIQDNESLIVSNKENNHIEFHTNNTERVRVGSTGKLEVYKGTSTTGKTSGSEAFRVGNGAGNYRFSVYPDGTTVIGGTGDIGNYNILLQNDGTIITDNGVQATGVNLQSSSTNSWFQTGASYGGINYVWAAKDSSSNVWHSGLQTDGDLLLGGNITGTSNIKLDGSSGNATFIGKINVGASYAGGEIFALGKSSGTSYLAHYNGGTAHGFIGHADQLVSGGSATDFAIRATNNLVFATNGNYERLRITSSGEIEFRNAATAVLKSVDTSGSSATDYGQFQFIGIRGADNDSHTYMTINNSGNVGIGTGSPGAKLEVRSGGTNAVSGTLFGGGFTQGITAGEPQVCFISSIDNTGNSSGTEAARGGIGFSWANASDRTRFIVGTNSNHAVRFYTNAGEKMRISASGNVGIGTNNPAVLLDVRRTSTTAYSSSATTNDTSFVLVNNGGGGHATIQLQSVSSGTAQTGQATITATNESASSKNTALIFGTRQNSDSTVRERLRITSDGNVGIGTDSPAQQLDVIGGNIRIGKTSNGKYIAENSSGQSKVIIDSSGASYLNGGNVGIGESNPTRLLYVASSSSNAYSSTAGSNGALLRLHNKDGTDNTAVDNQVGIELYVGTGATTVGMLTMVRTGNNVGDFTYKTRTGANSYAEHFRIQGAGRVGIGTDDAKFGQSTPISTYVPKLGVQGSIMIGNLSTTASDRRELQFYRRNGAAGQPIDTHDMGRIAWYGSNNDSDNASLAWSIGVTPDGGSWTSGANRKGFLAFNNHNGEQLRIKSNGQLNINASSESIGGRVLIKHDVDYTTTDFDDSPTLYLLNGDRTTGVSEAAIVLAGRNTAGSTFRAAISGNGSTGLKFYTTSNTESDDTPAMLINGSGNVGIGTNNPAHKLDVAGSINAKSGSSGFQWSEYQNGSVIWLDGANGDFSGGDYFNIMANNNQRLSFGYAGGESVYLHTNGKFGIGESTPAKRLHVRDGSSNFAITNSDDNFIVARFEADDARVQIASANAGGNGSSLILSNDDFHWIMDAKAVNSSNRFDIGYYNSNSSNQTDWNQNKSAYLTIQTNGNVGINQTNPQSKLTINGGTESVSVNISSTQRLTIGADGTWNYFKGKSGNGHYFNTSGGALFTITNGGYVGIGTNSPSTHLNVRGSTDGVVNLDTTDSRGTFIRFGQGGSMHTRVGCAHGFSTGFDKEDLGLQSQTGQIVFLNNGSTERMRIYENGQVNVVNPGGTTTTFSANGITQMSQERTFEFGISESSNYPTCNIGASQYAIGSFSGSSSYYYMVIEAWCHHRGYTNGGYSEYKKWIVLVGDRISSNLVEGSGNDNHLGLWDGSSGSNNGFNGVTTSGATMYLMVNPSCGARRNGRCRVRFYTSMPFTPDGSRTSSNTTVRSNQQSPFRGNGGSKPYIGNYSTTSNSANVHVSGGQLYESTSSIRYKTNVEDLQSSYADNVIDNLRPVWYRSKQENTDDPANHSYFGLIAEEVAEVEPRLVNYTQFDEDYEDVPTGTYTDEDGEEQTTVERQLKADAELRPQSVQYDRLSVMLLDVIQRQKQELAALTARVAALEAGN